MRNLTSLAAIALLALGTTSCTEETVDGSEAPEEVEDEGGQQPSAAVKAYPPGPYGVNVGSIIENYRFMGYAAPQNVADKANSPLSVIEMADFYNPTGSERFDPASPYGDRPKPKALLINVSAYWCSPCKAEQGDLLQIHPEYQQMGVEFFLQLADGPTAGTTAEKKHLDAWTDKYNTAWPAVYDPSYKLTALFEQNAFPGNYIVNTRTMEIVDIIAGAPQPGSSFFSKLEAAAQ